MWCAVCGGGVWCVVCVQAVANSLLARHLMLGSTQHCVILYQIGNVTKA